jgi:asparagine synthase (glutamine-hydrolysing)
VSGLAALFHRDGRPVAEETIWAMLNGAAHRGPDGMAVRCWRSVGLGHAKMAVLPEEEDEQQPLVSHRTGCALIADVRLDNRAELLARLPEQPAPTSSDAQLILQAYEAWGIDATEHLLGDFAFVLWDPRSRRLVCARDTGGLRTLFYRADSRTFAAASEIQQLLQDPAVPVAPNEERIREFLTPTMIMQNEQDHPETFYAGIFSIPAGHVAVVDADGLRVQRYWELEPPAELRYRRDEDYADHFRALFFEAVRTRLRSSRRVGALLSGGLDSSAVVCTSQELYRSGLASGSGFSTFSFGFDGLDFDERRFIEDVRAKYEVDTRYVAGGQFAGRLERFPRGFHASPNGGIREARDALFGDIYRSGARALLTGEVADACVGGSRLVFDSLLRQGRLPALWRNIQAYRRETYTSLRKTLALHTIAPLLPLSIQKHVMCAYVERGVRRNWERLTPYWLSAELRDDLSNRHLRAVLGREQRRRFANPTRHAESLLLYPPEIVGSVAPWPIEIRRPFADRRLHEFLLAIPPEQKFAPHQDVDDFYAGSKRVMRLAMRGILPESIRARTSKTIFDGLVRTEVQQNWADYQAVFGPGGQSQLARRGYVEPTLFWDRLQRFRAGEISGDLMYVMHVVGLETWLRSLALPRPQLVTIPTPWDQARQEPGGGLTAA